MVDKGIFLFLEWSPCSVCYTLVEYISNPPHPHPRPSCVHAIECSVSVVNVVLFSGQSQLKGFDDVTYVSCWMKTKMMSSTEELPWSHSLEPMWGHVKPGHVTHSLTRSHGWFHHVSTGASLCQCCFIVSETRRYLTTCAGILLTTLTKY